MLPFARRTICAEVAVLRKDLLEHREERLGQRDIDDLATAGRRPLVQRHQGTHHGVQPTRSCRRG